MSQAKLPEFMGDSTARFSLDGRYRFTLTRRWGFGMPLLFIGLNPSIADATRDDPTVARVRKRALTEGYGGLIVVNIFAYVSTDRSVLKSLADPVGEGNDAAIVTAAAQAGRILCGWGTEGNLRNRHAEVRRLLRTTLLHCLGVNRDGTPVHPLYQPYSKPLVEYA